LLAIPTDNAHRLAIACLAAQIAGALARTLALGPLSHILHRLVPSRDEDELPKPAMLLAEAVEDVDLALECAHTEHHGHVQRLLLMLERVREGGDRSAIGAAAYQQAGVAVGAELRRYLAAILDRHPGPGAVMHDMSLQQSVANTVSMHEALAEFVTSA